jgi:hypothetical protein
VELLFIPLALAALFLLTAVFVVVTRFLARRWFENDGSSHP